MCRAEVDGARGIAAFLSRDVFVEVDDRTLAIYPVAVHRHTFRPLSRPVLHVGTYLSRVCISANVIDGLRCRSSASRSLKVYSL